MSAAMPTALPRFEALGLGAGLLRGLAEAGCEAPSALQAAAIPLLLAGRDLIAEAEPGSGKTLAYVLPLLARADPTRRGAQALVLTAGDEAALRVAETVVQCARHLPGLDVWPLHRQSAPIRQRQAAHGAQVVVGTPRRLLRYLDDDLLALGEVGFVVLDDADIQLHSGFAEDIAALRARLPEVHQIAVFSATAPAELHRLAAEWLRQPAWWRGAEAAAGDMALPAIRQRYWQVGELSKFAALNRLIEMAPDFAAALVFAHRAGDARHLVEALRARGYAAAALEATAPQAQREAVAARLGGRQLDIVVGTDLAVDRLDLSRATHVVSYDPPLDIAGYARRLGAVRRGANGAAWRPVSPGAGGVADSAVDTGAGGARDGRRITAILLVTAREMGLLHCLEHAARRPIAPLELPERFR